MAVFGTRTWCAFLDTVRRGIRGIISYVRAHYLITLLSCRINNCGDVNVAHMVVILRMLVYEYVDNGNLEQWLHGDVGPVSPLTWEHRMKIILGTAKGCVLLSLANLLLLTFCLVT